MAVGTYRIYNTDLTYVNYTNVASVAQVDIRITGNPYRYMYSAIPLSKGVHAICIYSFGNPEGTRYTVQLWAFTKESGKQCRLQTDTGGVSNITDINIDVYDSELNYYRKQLYATSSGAGVNKFWNVHEELNITNIESQYPVAATSYEKYTAIMDDIEVIMHDILYGVVPPPAEDDPYDEIPDNDVEGGGGDFDDTSVDIDFPPTPTISVADAGFVSLLTPTLSQIQALSAYMWSTSFDETQIKKLFANPMDVFIGMSILPITVPSSSTKTINIAGINTGIVMNKADQQFVNVDFGTLTIKTGTGGSYLDYSPYTKASIFLPYIGWRDIDIDEIMGKTLQLRYCVDIVSGGCVAWLKCGGSVLYEWTGQCAVNIPLTSVDFTSTASAAISAVGHIGSAIGGMISGGASGAMSGASLGPGGIIAGAIGGGIGSVINGAAGLAQDALNAKPTFPKSGSLGGPAGVMGHQMAYICLHRPAMAKPKNQGKYMGYPSFITKKVSDLFGTGFNAFSDIRLQGLGLLDTEIAELTALLKGGVYL